MPETHRSAVAETAVSLDPYRNRLTPAPAQDLRPKLLRRGPGALSVTELVTLLLGGPSARARADRLIRTLGRAGLAETAPAELLAKLDRTNSGELRLVAALELHRRFRTDESAERQKLVRPADVHRVVPEIRTARKEHLVGLYLDAQNGLLCRETISIGSLNTTRTHPREILYPAIEHHALGFILVHNHPSGSLDPSDEDVAFTRSIQRAGEVMAIELYDHVIVAKHGYVSLRERGVF